MMVSKSYYDIIDILRAASQFSSSNMFFNLHNNSVYLVLFVSHRAFKWRRLQVNHNITNDALPLNFYAIYRQFFITIYSTYSLIVNVLKHNCVIIHTIYSTYSLIVNVLKHNCVIIHSKMPFTNTLAAAARLFI